MIVYRLEHPTTGKGPYCTNSGSDAMRKLGVQLCYKHDNSESSHPSPLTDGLNRFADSLFDVKKETCRAYFACPKLCDLYSWFDGFWPDLIETGYRVVTYDVKNYKMGFSGKQLAFDIRTAKRL